MVPVLLDCSLKRFVIGLIAIAGFAASMAVAQSAQSPEPTAAAPAVHDRDTLMNRGYELLKKGDRAGALQQFQAALVVDPTFVPGLTEIGYLKLQDGELQAAAASFEAARALAPRDRAIALQLGYIYDRLGMHKKAEEAFREALDSQDPKVRLDAATALQAVMQANRSWYLDLYASPFYTSRFDNFIGVLEGRLGWKPDADLPLSVYLGGSVTRDSRSQGGTQPIIFSDNVAMSGVGVLWQPRYAHFNVRAEANIAVPLVEGQASYKARSDFRAIGSYYNRFDGRLWGPLGLVTLGSVKGERFFSDIDGSLGYYSRYNHNIIAYLQVREGMRMLTIGPSQVFGYLKYNLAKDTHRDFYNNLGEGGAGVELRPNKAINSSLRVEYLHGAYFGIARDPNPYNANYNDFRVTLLFGQRF